MNETVHVCLFRSQEPLLESCEVSYLEERCRSIRQLPYPALLPS
jgi:hypothetical protein